MTFYWNICAIKEKPQPKEHFSLSAEKAKDFAFSDEPITVSEIVKRINDLIAEDNMSGLKTTVVTQWLVDVEALAIVQTPDGHAHKRPTAHGAMLGIRLEERDSARGPYSVVLYDRNAQQFLLDNLEAAVDLHRQKTQNQGLPWRVEDDQSLRDLCERGLDANQIATVLKRNSGAVRARMKKLGLTAVYPNP